VERAAQAFEETALPRGLIAVDDVDVLVVEGRPEPLQPLRLFFEVDIDQEHEVALRHLEAGHHRLVMPEVA
jgi:hypothetical protein